MKPKPQQAATATPVLTVSVQTPKMLPIDREIAVNGSITEWDPISVGSQVSGLEIKSVLVEEGSVVKKGQLLATLDSSVLVPQLESEKARYEAAVAAAKKAVQPNRQEDINGLAAAVAQAEANVADQQAAVVQAQANLKDASRNVERYQFLRKEGAVSAQEMDTRQTSASVYDAIVHSAEQKFAAAKFILKQAKEKLSMAQTGGRREDIQVANASVNESRGNIRRLEAQIQQTYIRAPVDGLITHRDIHIGDIAMAGKTMFSMARDDRLELRAQVAESDLPVVQPGESVNIHCAVTGTTEIHGTVREISPAVDSSTRLATARIDVPAKCGMKPGVYAEGRVAVGKTAVLTVPSRAVIAQDERSFVYVVTPAKTVVARTVTTGARSGDLMEIKSGLSPDDVVVTDGAGFLKDGDLVAVSDHAG
jgi:HlyD family secretion protein